MLLWISVFTIVGCLAGWGLHLLFRMGIRRRAQLEADLILQDARDAQELRQLEEKELLQDIEDELWSKVELDLQKVEDQLAEKEVQFEEKKQKLDQTWSLEKQKLIEESRSFEVLEKKLEEKNQLMRKKSDLLVQQRRQLAQKIAEKTSSSLAAEKARLADQLREEATERARNFIESFEQDAREHAETYGKNLLDIALNRFQRSYCPERGLAPVYLETPNQRLLFSAESIEAIQELTGCEVVLEEGMDFIGIAGFDPVRRELTRRVLERCLKEKRPIEKSFISKTGENIKKELLNTIRRDGDMIAKELKLEGLHPEIRQMMGSLRYRYSFTQNQYFHCGEVGWLCGLLATELGGVNSSTARRSGLLHDLGKSMDHELEGGHAVIGANFIEARKESAEVVHAVRAHHFDVPPEVNLDFLVIGADAISGARPGARRSTVESYNQKVADLAAIAKSFDGVQDCFILSGGRECRVLVNGKKIDDLKALHIGKNIAQRIENELQYPGQIKVVVVRETVAVESTRPH